MGNTSHNRVFWGSGILVFMLVIFVAVLVLVNKFNGNSDNSAPESTPTYSDTPVTPSTTPTSPSEAPVAPETAPTTSAPQTGDTDVLAVLNTLTVSPESNSGSYDRDQFNHWVGQDVCNTRVTVLIAEAVVAPQLDGCTVMGGEWVSVYDNQRVTVAGDLDIDHMVPLKEAWESGAYEWNADTREEYANDLGYEYSLLAVTASTNREKSDRDPSQWLPQEQQCWYVSAWVNVKHRWGLTVDQAEKNTITQVLNTCNSTEIIPADPVTHQEQPDTVANQPVEPQPVAPANGANDPQFKNCGEAQANGFGPYVKNVDPEYAWYRDGDKDGSVCE